MTKGLVFIHCFGGLTFEARPLIRYFEKKNNSCYEFKYKECFGQVSLKKIAEKLDDFVKEIKEDFILVGLSQGGIIGSYWLESLGGKKKCKDIITVCSPFHGSYLSYLLPLEGVKELRPKSRFLDDLRENIKKSDVKYHCIWNPLDLVVVPGSSARLDGAYKNKKIISLLHNYSFRKKSTKRTIEEVLFQTSKD